MFTKAVPVWMDGEERTMNSQLVLRAVIPAKKGTELHITCFSFYRLAVNGQFVFFGPARCAGGYASVDVIPLDPYLKENENEIVIEAAGYYCRSLSTVKQISFVIAEILCGGKIAVYTGSGDSGFAGYRSCRRLQKTERYSAQRHFGEVWDEREPDRFAEKFRAVLAEVNPDVTYLPRVAPAPRTVPVSFDGCAYRGTFAFDETLPYKANRYSSPVDKEFWGRYSESEVPYLPYRWLQRQKQTRTGGESTLPLTLSAGEYAVFDCRHIEVGFLEWCMEASVESDVVFGFSEMCFGEDFEFTNINAQNVMEVLLPAGKQKTGYSFEPYSFRFLIVMVKAGKIRMDAFGMRTFERDMSGMIRREIRDPELAAIYQAAIRTFAHNAVDLFSDCPSRERAGWLCDSYFTGKVEHFFLGKSPVEESFLRNFLLFDNRTGDWPEGVLPMCYPADIQENLQFIPQWDLWFVLESADYLTNRNPGADRESFRKAIYGVLNFIAKSENADGLAERIPSWNFVEWSTANEWTKDVNYPTNFLYSAALDAAADLYGDDALRKKAAHIRKTTLEKAFDGTYFVDHAVRGEDGELRNLTDTSEAGQYYAILFGGVDLNDPKYAKLREDVFGNFADRRDDGRQFVPVNAFIGLYLRISVLMKIGAKDLLREDLKNFFGGMVESTGTLWEYKQHKGSYDHGFASLAAVAVAYVEGEKV